MIKDPDEQLNEEVNSTRSGRVLNTDASVGILLS